MSNAPATHISEALKLNADDTIDLWELRLVNNTLLRFWNGPQRTWNGMTFSKVGCQLEGESANSDGQYARPTLTIANPDNSFGLAASQGVLDMAVATRRRVLQSDFTQNIPVCQPRIWIVGRPKNVTWQVLQLELRETTDMPNFKTPRRMFNPPAFPFVVLQ